MDIPDRLYYRINKILLSCLGQWPSQRTLYKYLGRTSYACAVISVNVPMIIRLFEVWGDMDLVIDCISILLSQAGTCMKFLNYIFNAEKIRKLIYRMQTDWKSDTFQPHLEILKKYALEGKKLTQVYSVCMYSTLITFVLMPVVPKLMDVIMPLNASRSLIYPLPLSYGNINVDKYYIPIMIHADCAILIAITTIVAMDSTYAVYVEHACGMFAAVGDRLHHLMDFREKKFIDKSSPSDMEKATYQAIVDCIEMHKEAIKFANTIESSHTFVLLLVVGLSVLSMSVAGYQVIMNLNKPNEAFRFLIFVLAQFFHLFYLSWPGQKLIDHSERIHDLVYDAKWYETSPRSQKLILLMMMRSIEPCKLTAGKFFDMSFANFSLVNITNYQIDQSFLHIKK
uniref:Odorant receptor n=1 Tax=Campoletis chlorideae TaxID=219166 RepID=A0A346D3Z3_9HYME|nr:odorant receptor [Campoletis chlorideae]